jgi:hypothetical protein
MTSSVRRLWEGLDAVEGDAFLDALYPALTRAVQYDRLDADRRTSCDGAVVLAMAAVLRLRERALVVRPRADASRIKNVRPAARSEFEMPAFPVLQELRGGPLDSFRMASNTAVLREHAAQVDEWADTVETICRARAMVVVTAVAEREAAARIATANAAIAAAELGRQQSEMGKQLLNDTLAERRDLARAITNIYGIEQGEPS